MYVCVSHIVCVCVYVVAWSVSACVVYMCVCVCSPPPSDATSFLLRTVDSSHVYICPKEDTADWVKCAPACHHTQHSYTHTLKQTDMPM